MKHHTIHGAMYLFIWALLILCSSAGFATETHVDGFGRLISTKGRGNYFLTHRGPGTDMVYIRTTADRFPVIWETQPVPAQVGDRVVFAWDTVMSGIYHRSGAFLGRDGKFLVELSMNGHVVMTFPIAVKGDTRTLEGKPDDPKHIELFFDYLGPDAVGNLNGITYFSVPAAMVTPGKPVTLKIQPKPADRVAFYAVGCTKGVWTFHTTVTTNPVAMAVPAYLAELDKTVPAFNPTPAPEAPVQSAAFEAALPDPEKRLHVAIISGLACDAEDAALMDGIVTQASSLFLDTLKYPAEHVCVLTDKASRASRKSADTSRETIAGLFRDWQVSLKPDDALLLMLVGNANKVDDRVMFNIRGPDMRPDDFGVLLDSLPCQLAVVCVFTPVSGAFIKPLAMRGRIVIAACGEDQIYRTSFAGPFLKALVSPAADNNGDGQVSLLEAFDSANQDVGALFAKTRYLRTEQALMDDTGDGVGSASPGIAGPKGSLAARFFLE